MVIGVSFIFSSLLLSFLDLISSSLPKKCLYPPERAMRKKSRFKRVVYPDYKSFTALVKGPGQIALLFSFGLSGI